ncbi:MAG TPA: hypothetical protein VJL58_03085, partial [Pyrinomonadaceae bacterium]|nr:hypothetical protein [Pyrinomonadaceae bacterium]
MRRALILTVVVLAALPMVAQKAKPAVKPVATMVFAVLNDGKLFEPIAAIKDGELLSGENLTSTALAENYKPNRSYSLIFGGKPDGSFSIVKSNIGTECGGSSADVTAKPSQTRLKGLVMALATNAKITKPGS